jgi:uncharacterized protein YoxC
MDTQLDPQLVNLAKSLRQVESGGNFQAKGKSGEYGAYQFMPDTWNNASSKFGVNTPLEKATPDQQNEVAYKQLEEWKQQHPDWNIGNFASAWNAGPGAPNAYMEKHSGTNSQGVSYDTPGYAKQVAETYQQIKQQNGDQSQPQEDNGLGAFNTPAVGSSVQTPTPAPVSDNKTQAPAQSGGGLLSKIGNGAVGILNSIEKPFIGLAATPIQLLAKAMGKPDPYAQGMPGIAGSNIPVTDLNVEKKLGDAAQVGSYFIPGEGILGAAGMGALQGAGGAMSDGKDLASVATQGGMGAAIGGALGGATKLAGGLLKSGGGMISGETAAKAQQGIKDAYSSALNLNAGERAFESRSGKDLAQVLVDNKVPLGRYENGTLDASAAIPKLQSALDPLNQQAKELLSKPQGIVKDISLGDTLDQVKNRIQKLSISQSEKNTAIQHATDLITAEAKHYGENVTPEVADQIKQGMWGSSFKGKLTSSDKLQGNVSYLTGNTLKDSIEKAIAGTDAEASIKTINQQRGDLIDAIKRLEGMDSVKLLKGGRLGKMSGGLIGTITGAASGAGPLGALAGDYFGQRAAEIVQNPAFNIGKAELKAKGAALLPKYLGNLAKPVGNGISSVGGVVQGLARPAGLVGNITTDSR